MTFAKEAWPFVLPFLVAAAVALALKRPLLAAILGAIALVVLLFFRIPARRSDAEPGVVLAPANGRITAIETVTDPDFGEGEYRRVVTFLSVFNVHVQRAPVAGEVIATHYRRGRKVAAFRADAGEINESRTAVIRTDAGDTIAVQQLAGLLARRVVSYLEQGDRVRRGDLIGVIKFGSRVDLYLPAHYRLLIEKGQTVHEGETPMATSEDRRGIEMTRIALLGTSTLLGDELKDELGRRRDLWSDLRLLTFEPESMSRVADLNGTATLVSTLGPETLEGVDLVILPGESGAGKDLEREIPGDAKLLIVAPDFTVSDATPFVADVNLPSGELLDGTSESRILVSPHPAVIALSLLLAPLRELGLSRASGLLIQPSSIRGQEGLDELLEQSRRILNFQPDPPMEIWGHQLAYNLLPTPRPVAGLDDDLRRVLGAELPVSIHVAQASVFHGCTVALQVDFDGEVDAETLTGALARAPHVTPTDEPALGPIDAAGRDDLQVAVQGQAGSFWLWAVFDNLTRGGALNAVAIVEALSKSQPN